MSDQIFYLESVFQIINRETHQKEKIYVELSIRNGASVSNKLALRIPAYNQNSLDWENTCKAQLAFTIP